MKTIIQIDGGIGRNICALPAVTAISKNNETYIICSCPDVFEGHPYISRIYPATNKYLFEDVIRGNCFILPEPYQYSAYYNNECHLIDAFSNIIWGTTIQQKPKFFLHPTEIDNAKQFIDKFNNGKPLVIVQPFGAGTIQQSININNNIPCSPGDPLEASLGLLRQMTVCNYIDPTYRSFSMQQAIYILDCLGDKYNTLVMSQIPINHPNAFQPNFTIRQWIALVSLCDNIISVDSCLPHIANAYDKRGIVFWGATSQTNLGYDTFINIRKQDAKYEYTPYRFRNDAPMRNSTTMQYTNNEILEALTKLE